MATARNEKDYLGSAYPFTLIRERLSRHPGPCLDFALGRRSEPPPAWVPGFVAKHAGQALVRHGHDQLDRFIAAASAMLARVYGVQVRPASILPAPSGRAAMSALAATLISPGDVVLVTEPGYPAFARLAAQRNSSIAVVALDADDGFTPDTSGLDRHVAIRLAALNYPNNPTGTVIGVDQLDALRERIGPDAVIFNDAIYGPLTYECPPYSMLADRTAGEQKRGLLELHSLGKLFSLGPLGTAFMVGDDELVAGVREYSDFAWTQLSALQIMLGAKCLEEQDHVERVRDRLRQRLDALRDAVAALGFVSYPTDAGMYLLCRAPSAVGGKEVGSAAEAADVLLADHGLAVATWDVPPHGYVRFSASYLPEELNGLRELGRGRTLVSA
jgi:aspartate/methionine/tyrosine aminotransferase